MKRKPRRIADVDNLIDVANFTFVDYELIERVFTWVGRQRASALALVVSCVGVRLPTTCECVSCQIALLRRGMVCLYENRLARR